MRENIVKKKTFEFALLVVDVYRFLCREKKEFVLSKQILRSGTAIGALVAEAEHAQSKRDFVYKFSVAQKEANETLYWLELLFKAKFLTDELKYEFVKFQLVEIQKIIASILLSVKRNEGEW